MIFLNRLKTLLRQPAIWMWTLVFPLCLASFEYAAFGRLSMHTIIDTIELSVVTEEDYRIEDNLLSVFREAKLDEDKRLFHITEVSTLTEGFSDFEAGKTELLLYQDVNQIRLKTKEASIAAGITTQVIEQYTAVSLTIQKAYEKYMTDLAAGLSPTPPEPETILQSLTDDAHYFNDISGNADADFLTIYFYSLIAMMCLYAVYWGKQLIEDIRADQSPLGIRVATAPTSKYKLIGLYYLAAAVLQLISCVVLFVYLKYILQVALGDNAFLVLLCMLIGSFTGISFGMVISLLIQTTPQKKEALLTVTVLVLCIFSGLMFVDLKHMMDMYLPFMKYINPAQLIVDCLYSLYYYQSSGFYWLRIAILLGMNFLFIGISIMKMRGETYASV